MRYQRTHESATETRAKLARCPDASSAASDGEACVAVTDGATVTVHSGEEEAAFSFDAAFASDKAQHDVYAELVAGPMAALFDGFNCTVLAYGQTGSGKTFTMEGAAGRHVLPELGHCWVIACLIHC